MHQLISLVTPAKFHLFPLQIATIWHLKSSARVLVSYQSLWINRPPVSINLQLGSREATVYLQTAAEFNTHAAETSVTWSLQRSRKTTTALKAFLCGKDVPTLLLTVFSRDFNLPADKYFLRVNALFRTVSKAGNLPLSCKTNHLVCRVTTFPAFRRLSRFVWNVLLALDIFTKISKVDEEKHEINRLCVFKSTNFPWNDKNASFSRVSCTFCTLFFGLSSCFAGSSVDGWLMWCMSAFGGPDLSRLLAASSNLPLIMSSRLTSTLCLRVPHTGAKCFSQRRRRRRGKMGHDGLHEKNGRQQRRWVRLPACGVTWLRKHLRLDLLAFMFDLTEI